MLLLQESLGFLKEIGCLTSSEDNANRLSQTCAVGDLHSWTAYINVKVVYVHLVFESSISILMPITFCLVIAWKFTF